ncbi:MAG: hypothetical protein WCK77_15445 [Verrucomicrobiota bacterium]
MSKPSSKAPPTGYPEFAVRRECFDRYFDKPMPSSTFHDMVGKGVIVPLKGLKGFYKLNDSLRRMGLREVPSLPNPLPKRCAEDIARLALTMIDPAAFPAPSWMLCVEALDVLDADHALLIADRHTEPINGLATLDEKVAYGAGVVDGMVLNEADTTVDGDVAD